MLRDRRANIYPKKSSKCKTMSLKFHNKTGIPEITQTDNLFCSRSRSFGFRLLKCYRRLISFILAKTEKDAYTSLQQNPSQLYRFAGICPWNVGFLLRIRDRVLSEVRGRQDDNSNESNDLAYTLSNLGRAAEIIHFKALSALPELVRTSAVVYIQYTLYLFLD